MARRNPVSAPRHASVIERLLKVRSPCPLNRNPEYAMVEGQRITRIEDIGRTNIARLGTKGNPQIRPFALVSVMAILAQLSELSS